MSATADSTRLPPVLAQVGPEVSDLLSWTHVDLPLSLFSGWVMGVADSVKG
jgi:hypothetical protein